MGQPAYNSNRLPKDAFDMEGFNVDEMVNLMQESERIRR